MAHSTFLSIALILPILAADIPGSLVIKRLKAYSRMMIHYVMVHSKWILTEQFALTCSKCRYRGHCAPYRAAPVSLELGNVQLRS